MKTNAISKRGIVIILDGFGINPNTNKNAIRDAKKPTIDSLFANYPFTTIQAGGELVGLPKGVAGNSEVGHLNLGAGKPVRLDLIRINEAIVNNTLKDMDKMQEMISYALAHTKRIHLMGLLSDGNVHSHIEHTKEIIKILSHHPELKIYLHVFTDGRDTAKDSGVKYVEDILKTKGYIFASMQGRSIGMDRDRRWEKIEHCTKTLTGVGAVTEENPLQYLKQEYSKGNFDEFVTPVLFGKDSAIKDGDTVFFTNFRPDRAKQLTLAFMDPQFKEFNVGVKPGYFLCMSAYVPDEVTLPILFDKEKVQGTVSEYLSKLGLKQFKIAETEKYAHVTYFFNGGEEKPFSGEERCLINSPKEVATYDLKPEMSAYLVTDQLVEKLSDKSVTAYFVNFANSDMVGHTGNYQAAVKAIEALDICVKKVVEKALAEDMTIIITADHGNSDQMVYEDGTPHTSHTEAPVPLCLIHQKLYGQKLTPQATSLALKDVAPTLLHCLGIEIPKNMIGKNIYE